MARPPKPAEVLKITGAYRADRHRMRDEAAKPTGSVEQPQNLDGLGVQQWNVISQTIVPLGYLTSADQHVVDLCCRLWSLLQNSIAAAQLEPTDKDARAAVVAYNQQWLACSARLGLSPIDRIKLAGITGKKSVDPADEFFTGAG
jgi:phage terminase small subunit